jgi:hypothetical protein
MQGSQRLQRRPFLGLSAKAVWQIGKRYQQGGLERAFYDASRPGGSFGPGWGTATAHHCRGL